MTFSELGEQITDPNKKWEDTLKEWVDEPDEWDHEFSSDDIFD